MKKYRKSDYFEKMKALEELRIREQEVREREFQLSVNEKLLNQDQKIEAFRTELKSDIQELKEKYSSLREFIIDQFAQITAKYDKEILLIKTNLQDFRTAITKELNDTKHHFGQEVLRIDRNAMQLVGQLEKYARQVDHYRKESEYIRKEAQQMQRDAQFILKRANHQYQKVEFEGKKLAQSLASYQGKMQLDFQKQKLLLDQITMNQHNALKDICYERQGNEILMREIVQRQKVTKANIESTKKDIQRYYEKISTERNLMKYDFSNQQKIQKLEDQLFFAKEKLTHQQNRLSLQNEKMTINKMFSNLADQENRLLNKQ